MAKAHLWAFVEQLRERCGWASDYSGVQSTPGSSGCHSNLAVNGAQGRLGQGKSRHSPPPLPRVFWNPHQPSSPVEGFHQLAFSSKAHTALASAPYSSASRVCGPCGVLPPPPPGALITLWLLRPSMVVSLGILLWSGAMLGALPAAILSLFWAGFPLKKTNMKYHLELTKCFPVYPVSSLPFSHLALMTVPSCCITVKGK